MIRVTLDSNVYISALEFGGVGARFLEMSRTGSLRIDISDAILEEIIGVLRDKFAWEGYRLHFARQAITRLANVVMPHRTIDVASGPDDNKVLECAVEAGSDFIVTSDAHLLTLGRCEGISILPPVEFLERTMNP